MDNAKLFNVAVDFLSNGADLPDAVSSDPRSAFLAACLREINSTACANEERSRKNEADIRVMKGIGGVTMTLSGSALLLLVLSFLEII
jgi:hypothetical protein